LSLTQGQHAVYSTKRPVKDKLRACSRRLGEWGELDGVDNEF
jgi:hypothetical protein